MVRRNTTELIRRLDTPRFRSWKDLPAAFLAETARLPANDAVDLAEQLWKRREHRFLYAALTLILRHPMAFRKVRWQVLERLGAGMDSWWAVDMLALLAGRAWRDGQVSDARVLRWARSRDRWWRRAALVCTVCLNRKAQGGRGDPRRTLAVCEPLAGDRDDVVAKGLSWALRDLIVHDRESVEEFLRRHDAELPALVRREVRNKLDTGRKNPPRRSGRQSVTRAGYSRRGTRPQRR